MRQSQLALLAMTFVIVLSGNLAAAPAAPLPRVVVRVFDTSGQPAPQLLAALDEAAALMSRASLTVPPSVPSSMMVYGAFDCVCTPDPAAHTSAADIRHMLRRKFIGGSPVRMLL